MATVRHRNGLWQVQIRLKGFKPVSESFRTERQARKWASDTEAAMKAGLQTQTLKDVRQLSSITLREVLLKFDETRQLKNSYRGALNSCLRDPIANLSLKEINKQAVLAWRNRLQDALKSSSVSKYARVPRGAWEFAVDVLELPLGPNPFNKLGLKDVKNRRWRRLTNEELDRLLAESNHFKNRTSTGPKPSDWKDLLHFAIATGMRRGEIVKARVSHLRGENNRLFLWIPETKTDRPRLIPLDKVAREIVQDRQEKGYTDRLFPYQARTLTRDFIELRKKAGVKDLTFHDLRHEALSRMNEKGLGSHELMLVSGHKTIENLSIYVNPVLERVADRLCA